MHALVLMATEALANSVVSSAEVCLQAYSAFCFPLLSMRHAPRMGFVCALVGDIMMDACAGDSFGALTVPLFALQSAHCGCSSSGARFLLHPPVNCHNSNVFSVVHSVELGLGADCVPC